jgi:hypothetical protein
MKMLLEQSVGLYRELLATTKAIGLALDNAEPMVLNRLGTESASLMAAIQELDQKLHLRPGSAACPEEHALARQRLELIEAILNLNQELNPRLNGLRALKRNELQQIRQGRTTVRGYTQSTAKAGRIINTAK